MCLLLIISHHQQKYFQAEFSQTTILINQSHLYSYIAQVISSFKCLNTYMPYPPLKFPLYDTSRFVTCTIVDSIGKAWGIELEVYYDSITSVHRSYQHTCDGLFDDLFSAVCFKLHVDCLCVHALRGPK